MRKRTYTSVAACALAAVTILAGCGGSHEGGDEKSAISEAGRRKAQQLIEPYVGHPNEFPINEALAKPVPTGSKIAYVDTGAPLVTLMYQLMEPAAKQVGAELYRVRADTSASGIQSAFGTVLQQRPAAVINTAIDPALWENQRKGLVDAGIPIISLGTVAGPDAGLVQPNSTAAFEKQGRLQAAWIVANNESAVHAVLYESKELSYSLAVRKGFEEELGELCPACTSRVVQIPLAEIGNKAPERVVSDLQSHPETDVVVFGSSSAATGLPAKLKVAGLQDAVQVVGASPVPTNLQYLKDRQSTVELGTDLSVLAWTAIDTAARLIVGQELQQNILDGEALTQQFLLPEDVTFDTTRGFSAYSDVADRFKKLWGQ